MFGLFKFNQMPDEGTRKNTRVLVVFELRLFYEMNNIEVIIPVFSHECSFLLSCASVI